MLSGSRDRGVMAGQVNMGGSRQIVKTGEVIHFIHSFKINSSILIINKLLINYHRKLYKLWKIVKTILVLKTNIILFLTLFIGKSRNILQRSNEK